MARYALIKNGETLNVIESDEAHVNNLVATGEIDSYVENGEMPETVPGSIITRLEFLQRFTSIERQDLYALEAVSTQIKDYVEQVRNATFIDLSRPDTSGGVQQLEFVPSSRGDGTNVLAVGRAVEILTP